MFFCDNCARKYQWPESYSKSLGPCEVCKRTGLCNDVPSYALPPKVRKNG